MRQRGMQIANIEVWICDYDVRRFQRMKDMDAVFSRPGQTMVFTRNDGSTVTVHVKDGLAEVRDTRVSNHYHIMEEEQLIER